MVQLAFVVSLMGQNKSVAIIGAGIAGLAAACKLSDAGFSVLLIEARSRIGGRIFTRRDPSCEVPIELGAEFIHGLAPEIWEPLQNSGVEISEVGGQNWCVLDRQLFPCRFFSEVDGILRKMDDSLPDESFLEFMERRFANPDRDPNKEQAKNRALAYVSGFNAADPELVGVHWLVEEMRAEELIEGHRAFRSENGYEDLLGFFRQQLAATGVTIRTSSVVESIRWKSGNAELTVRSQAENSVITVPRVLVTLPLSLLKMDGPQLGVVQFTPSLPAEKLESLNKLEMGQVIRVVLRFPRRFWEDISADGKSLSEMSFLFSDDEWFPTWWTAMPARAPLLTGWAPFRCAERLSNQEPSVVVQRSLRALSELLGVSVKDLENWLESAHFHDWNTDPFSRGAYSYGKIGSDGAQAMIAGPVENTLFFAGEATDTSGHNGTVHGAIASGYRAAEEIIRAG